MMSFFEQVYRYRAMRMNRFFIRVVYQERKNIVLMSKHVKSHKSGSTSVNLCYVKICKLNTVSIIENL